MPRYEQDDVLSLSQVAGLLGLTRQRVHQLVKDGKLPAQRKANGRPLVRFGDVHRFVRDRKDSMVDGLLRHGRVQDTINDSTDAADPAAEIAKLAYPDRRPRRR